MFYSLISCFSDTYYSYQYYSSESSGVYGGGGEYGGGEGEGGHYYAVYAANSETSTFKPLYPVVIDNGKIFKFAQVLIDSLLICPPYCY